MAIVKPFKAIRPAAGYDSTIAALPYDVYNRKEATEIVKKNPYSFLAIDRAETSFPDSVDTYADEVYAKAASLLQEWIAEGKFIQEDKACFYLYELTMEGRVQTGIVGCASIDDYINEVIKKHENTRADKEIDRIRHVDTCNMQTGPIFLTYKDNKALADIITEVKKSTAVYDFTSDDGIRHRVWVIDKEDTIRSIAADFETIDSLYIADGHHRCASAVKVGLMRREQYPDYTGEEEFNTIMSVIFQESELKILDYNRVVKDLNGYSEEAFLEKIGEHFEINAAQDNQPYHPEQKGCFGMYLEGKWYTLRAKASCFGDNVIDNLDVSVLQNYLLGPVLGIADPKTDKRIDFVGGIRGLKELEKRCANDMKIAFSMYPTSVGELIEVADAKLQMPPKSTWFEPKLRSGIFLHDLK